LGEQTIREYFKIQPTVQIPDISDKARKCKKKDNNRKGARPHYLLTQSPNSETNIYRSEPSTGLKTSISTKAIRKSEQIRRSNEKHKKRYSSPVTGLEWPRGFQEVKVPRFLKNVTEWW
jgi:hypothetical protein